MKCRVGIIFTWTENTQRRYRRTEAFGHKNGWRHDLIIVVVCHLKANDIAEDKDPWNAIHNLEQDHICWLLTTQTETTLSITHRRPLCAGKQ